MEQLLVGINAQDNATPVLEKFKRSINQVGSSFDDLHKGADKFGSAMLSQATKLPGVADSFGIVGKALETIKTPFVQIPLLVGAAITSMLAFANSNMKTVNELKRMSETTGISVNALAALKKVGAQTETSFESIIGAVTKLEKNLGESGKAFKKLKVEGHEPLEVLASLADRFKATNDPVDRARLGFLAFGKTWKDMAPMLSEGGDAIRKAAEATTISESMVMRYDKMHRDQIAINGAASAWKSALGDLASGPLSLITSMLAAMAKTSAEVAKNIRSATNKESDREYAEKWASGSDSAAQAKLKSLTPEDLKKKSGLNFQADPKLSTADVRNQWALDNFKNESLESQEAILNGYKNRGNIAGVLGDLTEQTVKAMESNFQKLKSTRDKILGQGNESKTPSENSEFKAVEDSVKAYQKGQEQIAKLKDKMALDSISNDREKESVALAQRFQDEQFAANGNSELLKTIQEKYRQDISILNKKWDKKEWEENYEYKQAEIKSIGAARLAQLKIQKDQEDTVAKSKAAYQEEVYKAQLKREEELCAEFSSKTSQLLTTPFETFVKHVGSQNMTLRGMFNDLWDDILTGFGNMLAKMLAEYMAKAVILTVLNAYTGGGASLAYGAVSTGSAMFAANGTDYSPGGRTIVAERESEMILPRGAQVIPMSKLGGSGDTITYNISTEGLTEKQLIRALGTADRERKRKRIY